MKITLNSKTIMKSRPPRSATSSQRPTGRSIRHLTGASVLALTSLAFLPTAEADAGLAMACDPGFYQVVSGQLAALNPGAKTYQPIGAGGANYNALGYRLADGMLYAIEGNSLIRIDAGGSRMNLGQLDLAKGAYTGDFDDAGYLNVSRGGRDWHRIDVDTMDVTPVPSFEGYVAVADIANVHGTFFGVSSDGTLYSFDQSSGERREVGQVSGLPETLKAYGAAWATAGGNLYVARNSGEIFQITGYTTSSPTATQVGTAPETRSNDGASCSLAAPMPGLDDVDGPEPESPPQTDQAKQASAEYEDNYETYRQTFSPAGGIQQDTPTLPEDTTGTYQLDDAGIGIGPSCDPGGDIDRLARDHESSVIVVSEPTVLFRTESALNLIKDFNIVSGRWSEAEGRLTQHDTCGYDYAALLGAFSVQNFLWETTVESNDKGAGDGGLVIHQASTRSRSGAMLIDISNDGETIRWGEYDSRGYYQPIGSVPTGAGDPVTSLRLSVLVYGPHVEISLNDELIATVLATNAEGLVGLSSSLSTSTFSDAALTALPARLGGGA